MQSFDSAKNRRYQFLMMLYRSHFLTQDTFYDRILTNRRLLPVMSHQSTDRSNIYAYISQHVCMLSF